MAQKKIFGKVLDLIGLEESAIDEEDNYEGFDDYEDEYQDDFDDYQEEEYEEPVKKSSRKSRASKRAEKNSRKNNRDDFDYGYEDEVEEEDTEYAGLGRNGLLGSNKSSRRRTATTLRSTRERDREVDQSSKVVGFNPKIKMIVYQPMSYDDTQNIVDNLKRNKPVIVNLEAVDKQEAQRTLDFISGAIYAINGDIQKINSAVFVLVPANVDISGNIPDDLKGKSFYTLDNQRRDY